jgi:acid stress chaperone HdeB
VTNTKLLVAGLLFHLVTVTSARAEIPIDLSRITCKELLLDTPFLQDNVAYWLNGYYNGKRGNKVVVDMVGMKDYVNKFEQYCLTNKEVTVLKAAEAVLGGGK